MQANEAIEKLRAALDAILSEHGPGAGMRYVAAREALAATATIDPPARTLPESAPDTSQEWAKLDGAIAWHLIERHADNWNEVGNMMESWLAARSAAVQPAADHACPRDTPYGPAVCGECVDEHGRLAEGEREAFEAWVRGSVDPADRLAYINWLKRDEGGEYSHGWTESNWQAWQARGQQAGAPEGFAIVPEHSPLYSTRLDAARFRYIEDNGTKHGGGNGFTITCFVPVDHEDMGCGIDAAIARAAIPGGAK